MAFDRTRVKGLEVVQDTARVCTQVLRSGKPSVTLPQEVSLHLPFIRRTLNCFGIGFAELDDLVQDVALVACRRVAEFRGYSDLRTWLYAISWRVARYHYRRKRRIALAAISGDSDCDENSSHHITPLSELIRSEDLMGLAASFWQLRAGLRDILALRDAGELSVPELSALLHCSEPVVRARLVVARRQLGANFRRLSLLEGQAIRGSCRAQTTPTSLNTGESELRKWLRAGRSCSSDSIWVHWSGLPSVDDTARLRSRLARLSQTPIRLCTVIEQADALPSFATRMALAELAREVPQVVHGVVLVDSEPRLGCALRACAWMTAWRQAFFGASRDTAARAISAAGCWVTEAAGVEFTERANEWHMQLARSS